MQQARCSTLLDLGRSQLGAERPFSAELVIAITET
jgi:hypothetical protein